jgi:hypothetical protein
MLWDVVSTWKAPTPLFSSYLLSTFSHFANRSNSIQYYLNRKFQTFNCFPHRVIHTLLDGLNIHLLNISKKLIRTWFCFSPDGSCCCLVFIYENTTDIVHSGISHYINIQSSVFATDCQFFVLAASTLPRFEHRHGTILKYDNILRNCFRNVYFHTVSTVKTWYISFQSVLDCSCINLNKGGTGNKLSLWCVGFLWRIFVCAPPLQCTIPWIAIASYLSKIFLIIGA